MMVRLRYRGVQAITRRIVPEAVCTHCKARDINLSILHASKEVLGQEHV